LIRFICVSPHKVIENPIGQRLINILRKLLSKGYWSEVTIKLSFFDRSLVQNDYSVGNNLAICFNALEVIAITLQEKPATWIVSNAHHLERLLEKCVKSESYGKDMVW
jgi:transformation/transcription domain-associated protein